MRRFQSLIQNRAENIAAEAQANLTAAGDSGRVGLIGVLVTLAYARCEQHKCAEGLRDAEDAMDLARLVYPPDSLPAGHVLMTIGYAKWKTGDSEEAERMMLQGVNIERCRSAEFTLCDARVSRLPEGDAS